ncbi:surp module family protein [Aphelenchoides avenae]|nr:surp module family protein [Aphelenchus avenae]
MEKLKKKKDEEEQMKLQQTLQEFQSTFEHGVNVVGKTFIKSEVVNANKTVASAAGVYKANPLLALAKKTAPPSLEAAKKLAEETAKKIMEQAKKQKVPVNRPPKPGSKPEAKTKKSNLEIFKEELKQMQEMRQERRGLREKLQQQLGVPSEAIDRIAPSLDNPYLNAGSEYDEDPNTTNLYICNLPTDVNSFVKRKKLILLRQITLEEMYETFGTFGPLASAKILYPRHDEERRREHLCGFIAYMARTDAERAMKAMGGERVKGCELRVSWAKPVPIPPTPFYIPPALRELSMPDPPSGLPFNARPRPNDLRRFLRKYKELPALGAPLPPNQPELSADYNKMLANAVVRVVIPTERPLLMLIHRMIEFVVREGPQFEAMIMAKERPNPMFRFLYDNHHPTHVYYRWKLYSVLQGEDRYKWRLERFRMFHMGSWWEPPPHALFSNGMPPALYETAYQPRRRQVSMTRDRESRDRVDRRDRSRERRRHSSESEHVNGNRRSSVSPPRSTKKRGVLSSEERKELSELLHNVIPEKTSVGDATMWCVEHADCAKEIVRYIVDSIMEKDVPFHKKIARMYLVSDILANCGARVRDVFYYRQFFSDRLVDIFVALNQTLERIESRLKAEQFRQRVMLCFRMWEDNSIYPTDVLINLQNIFLGLFKPDQVAVGGDDDDEEDIDGKPLDALENDIDGMPLEDDGFQSPPAKKPAKEPAFKPITEWSTVSIENEVKITSGKWDDDNDGGVPLDEDMPVASNDYEDIDGEPMDTTPGRTNADENETPGRTESRYFRQRPSVLTCTFSSQEDTSSQDQEYNEERRKQLREIEVKVLKLQDELESEKCPNIDEELAKYRKKLVDQMEEKIAKGLKKRSQSKDHEEKKSSKSSKEKEERSSKHKKHSKETPERERDREPNGRERDRDGARHRSRSERDRDRSPEREDRRRRDRSPDRDRRRH